MLPLLRSVTNPYQEPRVYNHSGKNPQWLLPDKFVPLTQQEVERVEKFVFFVGYQCSGHSIVGTMMDSHPNMIIAHEFQLFDMMRKGKNVTKHRLFNNLYKNSFNELVRGARGFKGLQQKGYLLGINGTWQAKFSQLKVIGNKKGGRTSNLFSKNAKALIKHYHQLTALIDMPVLAIHVVRNPFDMIATRTLYAAGKNGHRHPASETSKYRNIKML